MFSPPPKLGSSIIFFEFSKHRTTVPELRNTAEPRHLSNNRQHAMKRFFFFLISWCPRQGRRLQRLSRTGNRNRRWLGSGGWISRCSEWRGKRRRSHRTTGGTRRRRPLRTDGHVHLGSGAGVRLRRRFRRCRIHRTGGRTARGTQGWSRLRWYQGRCRSSQCSLWATRRACRGRVCRGPWGGG